MTQALCLRCGQIKFGALCPCPRCQAASTGDVGLDITFSDHHLSYSRLQELGRVVEALRAGTQEPEVAFWAFIAWVSEHHPDILQANLQPDMRPRVDALLQAVTIPAPQVSERNDPNRAGRRPWWRFWG